MTKEIFSVGVDVNARNSDGFLVVFHLYNRFPLDVLMTILKAGARTDIRDNQGQSPLTHRSNIDRLIVRKVKVLEVLQQGVMISKQSPLKTLPTELIRLLSTFL